ncbi:LCCL domain protein [Penicillium brasilianum]|uniref:LCCL domain protein n=1 Tax=Penicillium brasilianum TaxID=104259 RepID=A0A1S9RKX5_PENBI|nr:LCCL domain protein [Penicillium brasilianum]
MHTQRRVNDGDKGIASQLPEVPASPTYSLEDLSPPRYKDEEDSERARRAQAQARVRARASGEYGDLELGSVPLLPAGHPDEDRDLDDSDSDFFDYEEQGAHWDHPPLSCTLAGFTTWLRGPVPPHVYHIKPWFPRWQAAPSRLIERWAPRRGMKIALVAGGLIFWIFVFFASLQASVAGQEITGYGRPVKLSCHHRLWTNATDCGLNGDHCLPLDEQSFAFSCPAGCSTAILLEPYDIGNTSYNYRPLVIGGKPFRMDGRNSGIYRGDSSICASALHAGLISDAKGGCGILHRRGERDNFQNYTKNGIESISFKPLFPMSFMLTREVSSPGSSEAKLVECSDIRWSLFVFTLCVTVIFSMTVTSAPIFYSITFFIVWFQVAMASDPPGSRSFYGLLQVGLGRFLPGSFVGFALYYFCVRKTLVNLEAHADKTILWLGGCWVGALNSDTFDRIPISRLTPHDLQQQPGAITALIIIIGILIATTFIQAHCFRWEGRLLSTLRLYGIMFVGIIVLVLVPHMNLRIHHYILALLLIPGTTLQTRPSLLFQGILLGLFINGIARWGFDSVLQTPASLLEGGRLGTIPPPMNPPHIEDRSHLVFSFPEIPPHVDGISVIVNDVLRYQGFKSKDSASVPDFAWSRRRNNQEEYFRLGYVHLNALGGVWYEDFSAPSTWAIDGNFYYPG